MKIIVVVAEPMDQGFQARIAGTKFFERATNLQEAIGTLVQNNPAALGIKVEIDATAKARFGKRQRESFQKVMEKGNAVPLRIAPPEHNDRGAAEDSRFNPRS